MNNIEHPTHEMTDERKLGTNDSQGFSALSSLVDYGTESEGDENNSKRHNGTGIQAMDKHRRLDEDGNDGR